MQTVPDVTQLYPSTLLLQNGCKNYRVSNTRLAPDVHVSCSCDSLVEVPVMRSHCAQNANVWACLCCNKIDFTKAIIEEPRPHDVRVTGNDIQELTPETRSWLTQWPRCYVEYSKGECFFALFPASTVCKSHQELKELGQKLLSKQVDMNFREKIIQAGFPPERSPLTLPKELQEFHEFWKGLSMSLAADVHTILGLSDASFVTSPFAETDLSKNPEYYNMVLQLAASRNTDSIMRGFTLISRHQWKSSEVFRIFSEHLNHLLTEKNFLAGEFALLANRLCDLFYSLRPETKIFAPPLTQLADVIDEQNYYLRKRCLDLAKTLRCL